MTTGARVILCYALAVHSTALVLTLADWARERCNPHDPK
jgi:hypothetical protein